MVSYRLQEGGSHVDASWHTSGCYSPDLSGHRARSRRATQDGSRNPDRLPFWDGSRPQDRRLQGKPPISRDLVEHLHPAVVHIRTTHTVRGPQGEGQDSPFDEFLRRYFGDLPQRQVPRHSLGSGFLITKDG